VCIATVTSYLSRHNLTVSIGTGLIVSHEIMDPAGLEALGLVFSDPAANSLYEHMAENSNGVIGLQIKAQAQSSAKSNMQDMQQRMAQSMRLTSHDPMQLGNPFLRRRLSLPRSARLPSCDYSSLLHAQCAHDVL